jgi:RNA-directed DNA polymerase
MQQERREVQDVAKSAETPFSLRGEEVETPYTDLIASRAKRYPGMVHQTLMHHFSVKNLRQAYAQIKGSKAVGRDGITKKRYGEQLEDNLQALHIRMRKMAYRPSAARLVLIPKPDGRKRPIAISNFEDKLVQKIAADILTAIYEREFMQFSFGFRPERSCHGAIGYLHNKLKRHNHLWVADVDLENFFNSIDHEKLMEILQLRICDKRFLRYIKRMLKAGILAEGNCQEAEVGTPQGSIVSPILANIYLHHVLDEWFDKSIRKQLGGKIVRYADDFVAAFATEAKAKEFVRRLDKRLRSYSLSLNQAKTHLICFDRNDDQSGTFNFLGFTFYWGQWRRETMLKVKTSLETLRRKIQDFVYWIKGNRSRYKIDTLWEKTKQKLQGHYNYFGVFGNKRRLLTFYHQVVWQLYRWLNRRSQKLSYSWAGFQMRLLGKSLPRPDRTAKLIQLTNPRLYCV